MKLLEKLKQILKPKKEEKISIYTPGILDNIGPGDIVIDCGSNTGDEAVKFAEKGATVYAFEPNPHAFKVLQENTKAFPNVTCFNRGVLDHNDKLKLYMHKDSDQDELTWSTASSLLDFKGNIKKDKYVEIEVISLSEFIKSLGKRIKVLKMDVEGVEVEIVNNLIDMGVINLIDQAYVEMHDERVPELKESSAKLRDRIKANKIKNINLNWI